VAPVHLAPYPGVGRVDPQQELQRPFRGWPVASGRLLLGKLAQFADGSGNVPSSRLQLGQPMTRQRQIGPQCYDPRIGRQSLHALPLLVGLLPQREPNIGLGLVVAELSGQAGELAPRGGQPGMEQQAAVQRLHGFG